jgi:DNA-directed RNA polymerase specialized sigma24 family protein
MGLSNRAKASDAELLRIAARDPEAFGVFYDRFEADVLAYFWRRTRRADVSADLAGEVFATALECAPRFDPALGTARAWLYGSSATRWPMPGSMAALRTGRASGLASSLSL